MSCFPQGGKRSRRSQTLEDWTPCCRKAQVFSRILCLHDTAGGRDICALLWEIPTSFVMPDAQTGKDATGLFLSHSLSEGFSASWNRKAGCHDRAAPRRRARRNRALVKTTFCSLEYIALKHLQRGAQPRRGMQHQRAAFPRCFFQRRQEAARSSCSRRLLKTLNRVLMTHRLVAYSAVGTVATNQEHHRSSVHVLHYHVQQQLCRFPIGCPAL